MLEAREGNKVATNNLNYADMIEHERLPRHIAIIMDGNGRWARKRLMPRTMGHRAGINSIRRVVEACVDIGIPVLTVFAFSTENWKRPLDEVDYLMKLLVEFLHKELKALDENNIRISILGNYELLPDKCKIEIAEAVQITQDNSGMSFNIALNYGSRSEILEAVRCLAKEIAKGEISAEDITEEHFSSLLYTKGLPDPDLLIRTAGEMRLSNFLLWQIAYTELWVTDLMWPDFSREELLKAIWEFQQRDRRFGGLSR